MKCPNHFWSVHKIIGLASRPKIFGRVQSSSEALRLSRILPKVNFISNLSIRLLNCNFGNLLTEENSHGGRWENSLNFVCCCTLQRYAPFSQSKLCAFSCWALLISKNGKIFPGSTEGLVSARFGCFWLQIDYKADMTVLFGRWWWYRCCLEKFGNLFSNELISILIWWVFFFVKVEFRVYCFLTFAKDKVKERKLFFAK